MPGQNPVNRRWNIVPYWRELLREGKIVGLKNREEFDQYARLLIPAKINFYSYAVLTLYKD